jgi:putative restriction endonuclease
VDVVERLSNLRTWKRGDERAPHKPLLLLYAIARYAQGGERFIPFTEIDDELQTMLREFGHPRKTVHPHYPFWHLQSDGIWEVHGDLPDNLPTGQSLSKKRLLAADAAGGLSQELYEALQDRNEAARAIKTILEREFPDTYHEDILSALGLDLGSLALRRRRDPNFRHEILRAYENSCAICGYTSRLSDTLVGVEAAHIKWHQHGGPDTTPNGVALCALHHKLFDRGIIAFSEDHRVLVSENATGSAMFSHMVLDFNGHPLREPIREAYSPDPTFREWHVREVFREPARPLADG